jgi:predicted transcriptional regulator
MRRSEAHLGELELEVMKVLWERGAGTVLEVAEVLSPQRGCARTTILTILQRLHKKGLLRRRKVDGVFRYEPSKTRAKVMGGLLSRFVERVFDGSSASLVQHLTRTRLSQQELAEIRRIVDEARTEDR